MPLSWWRAHGVLLDMGCILTRGSSQKESTVLERKNDECSSTALGIFSVSMSADWWHGSGEFERLMPSRCLGRIRAPVIVISVVDLSSLTILAARSKAASLVLSYGRSSTVRFTIDQRSEPKCT
ncbi:hypothetical protein MPTK1_5g16800 [Marchantia polymorpha subsp. ruderalis]|uniref:Uncharacterized protein n=2 Tax=Marchantia polymorpha TaxID=3197 RepID=A0AAF6BJ32_MARPO|nr:hypothetical protein MARPO_0117s0026 [Marchantia polymorpha]BBN12016.1 hypothetical protein Mp_5g16800 [Marchantia polymorpha subsp. ruderalis]|eukprot:PTQ30967.1 hypothetical protein MARPO_0117s0026 [Marchantia polymorpha]